MSNTDQKSAGQDEIDLGQLLKRIGDGIQSSWLGFMRFLALLRNVPLENKFSFVAITSVSVALAIAYSLLLRDNYYESTMILSSHYLNKRLVDNTIEKLDALAEEDDKAGLARLFNISDSLAENIIGFEAKTLVLEEDIIEMELLREQLRNAQGNEKNEEVIDQVIKRLEIENRHSFEITIRTLSPTVIPNLQEALVGYFRNNDYVKRRIEINMQNLQEKEKKLTEELQKMDSLKLVIYANYKSMAEQARSGSNNVILSDRSVTNPVEIYNQYLTMYEELQNVRSQIYLKPDFEIVDGFTAFSEPASPGTVKMVLWALLLGILVAYLDVAVRNFNRYLATIK